MLAPGYDAEAVRSAAAKARRRVRYLTDVELLEQIPPAHRGRLRQVAKQFAFRVNDYYLSLIDWSDPDDPIRRLVIPEEGELEDDLALDASNEHRYTRAHGCQHKYADTALLLVNEVCGAYCRYCFRKRLFQDGNDEASLDVSEGVAYIAAHPEISNVLLTGGDPLMLSTRRLGEILAALRSIPHIRIIRIGSKMPAFNPFRLLDDPAALEQLDRHSHPAARIYLMCHFDHPRELTEPVVELIDTLLRRGVVCVNQCPLIRGINDDAGTLRELFCRLSWMGCPQYYLFQCRPTAGNAIYSVPMAESYRLFCEAQNGISGLARRPRLVMSHETGKIEIAGMDERHIYLRYHRAANTAERGRMMIYERDDRAHWLDDLVPAEIGALVA